MMSDKNSSGTVKHMSSCNIGMKQNIPPLNPTTSKKKLRPNILALKSTPPSPVGKNFNTFVKVRLCNEHNIHIVDLVKANGDTPYGKPWRDLLRDEPFTLLDIYHIILMAACRDPTCPLWMQLFCLLCGG